MPPLVLVDTREQAPLQPFVYATCQRMLLATERVTLAEGDYALAGFPVGMVALERKSIADLWGTLFGSGVNALGERTGQVDRFRSELDRLRGYSLTRILVEGDKRGMYAFALDRSCGDVDIARKHYKAILGLLISFEIDYGVPVQWAGSRDGAAHYVGAMLTRVWEQHTGGEDAKKAAARGIATKLPWWREEPTAEALEASSRAALHLEAMRTLSHDTPTRRFAEAGGMPLTYSARETALRVARKAR